MVTRKPPACAMRGQADIASLALVAAQPRHSDISARYFGWTQVPHLELENAINSYRRLAQVQAEDDSRGKGSHNLRGIKTSYLRVNSTASIGPKQMSH
jgi:hypothetical protein